ncbi:EF-hand domain-containing protein [Alteromonas pelagimontana]|uniref:EF-hand domain-containing protein n=1 Tax=Alteromonas pelagimontana TaxID=1858656 RepID=A0A6M4MGC8_9ALTE|nr:EF-hand domain-containing protein [Alteromonas pelagimontana]QJR82133.1 EF-hand domain-containing protein [Alteromonas pelagimontana]
MKKLLLVTVIGAALSACSPAGDDMEKIESTFAELDENSNGYLTNAEVDDEGVASYFTKIDTDSDQQISKNEFESYLQSNPESFEDDIIQTAQKNSKGDIEPGYARGQSGNNDATVNNQSSALEQNTAQRTSPAQQSNNGRIAKAEFDRMDVDKSGELTKAEASRDGVNEAFNDIDENNDQLLSRMEYVDFYQNRNSSSGN